MTYQRQEMEKRLPAPSQLLCSYLWSRLNDAGLRLSQQDVIFLSRLFCDYVQNTKEGKRTVLKLLQATTQPADPRHSYHAFNRTGPSGGLEPKDLEYFAGWLYKGGLALGTDQVEVDKNGNLEACEATGILAPKGTCVQVVKEYGHGGKERLTSLSNYARLHSQDPNIRDTANPKVCSECPLTDCEFHPQRLAAKINGQQLKLLPVRNA